MKVQIQLDPEITAPYITIHASALTPDIEQLIDALSTSEAPIAAMKEDRIVLLRPEDLYMARVENGTVFFYTATEKYVSKKRLYELEQQLGYAMIRISKTTLVNIRFIDYVELSFGGALLLKLKNKEQDYVSRKYLPAFKKAIGI
ncbi:LytTR family DNA-binding domain-containing protein [Dubosiella muris]|uniref:LytTR family transcriptional regulator n=2 Tax=Dubosiella TaxID=1937008 RepID=A0AC61R5M4_9FIRM|nr:LytTR family DNA-binding domain-containing protein [Dubosiella muris]TGY65319.1 LytTR family transcriptional regulator [Dubosiella muris]